MSNATYLWDNSISGTVIAGPTTSKLVYSTNSSSTVSCGLSGFNGISVVSESPSFTNTSPYTTKNAYQYIYQTDVINASYPCAVNIGLQGGNSTAITSAMMSNYTNSIPYFPCTSNVLPSLSNIVITPIDGLSSSITLNIYGTTYASNALISESLTMTNTAVTTVNQYNVFFQVNTNSGAPTRTIKVGIPTSLSWVTNSTTQLTSLFLCIPISNYIISNSASSLTLYYGNNVTASNSGNYNLTNYSEPNGCRRRVSIYVSAGTVSALFMLKGSDGVNNFSEIITASTLNTMYYSVGFYSKIYSITAINPATAPTISVGCSANGYTPWFMHNYYLNNQNLNYQIIDLNASQSLGAKYTFCSTMNLTPPPLNGQNFGVVTATASNAGIMSGQPVAAQITPAMYNFNYPARYSCLYIDSSASPTSGTVPLQITFGQNRT